MATSRKKKATKAMPLLAAALFCEKVLEDKDNVMTLVRIVDKVLVQKQQVNMPMPPTGQQPIMMTTVGSSPILTALLAFKSGNAKGKYLLQIIMVSPSGKRKQVAELPITFLGNEQGVNVRAMMGIQLDEEGLFWYEVRIDDRMLTRMPLRISYESQTQKKQDQDKPSDKKGNNR